MWVLDWCLEMLLENGWIILISSLLLTAAASGCFFCRDRGFYVAFAVMIDIGAIFV